MFSYDWHMKVKVAQSCPTICDPMDYSPWNSSGQNTGVGSLSLLQGFSPTQGSNPGLPHCRWILYQISHKGSPFVRLKSESESEVTQSCPTLCDRWTVARQAPPSMGFSRQEYWSGLPFPSPGDLPNPGIEPRSSTLQADALTSAPPRKPKDHFI